MFAIQLEDYRGYDGFRGTDVPNPTLSAGEVLIDVRFATLSPLDGTIAKGILPPAKHKPLPLVPGGPATGVVVDAGDSDLPVGARVIVEGNGHGIVLDGSWREQMAVKSSWVQEIPTGVDETELLAMKSGAGYLSGYLALRHSTNFTAGQSVLAPGIGGAVGMGTVEVARNLGAAHAISTASTTAKAEQAAKAGFSEVIDLSQESLAAGVRRITGGRGVDVVVDGVGGDLVREGVQSLAHKGTYVSVGYSAGTVGTVDVTDLIWKQATMTGFGLLGGFGPDVVAAADVQLEEWLAAWTLHPIVARTFPLAHAADALRYLVEGRPFGRVLLDVAGSVAD